MTVEEGVTFNISLVGFESMTKTVLDAKFISWGLSTGSHREQGARSKPQMFGHWKWQFAVEP